jgi:glucose/arabinose dehydrogenase/type 1 glutamine amidotransferase
MAVGLLLRAADAGARTKPRVLVFSKTAAFRHTSITVGVQTIRRLGATNGFDVDATEDASTFSDASLRRYAAVVFLSTTGDVLDAAQQGAFERYVRGRGGFVGIHAAADTEYDWPFYGGLVGAYFRSHPIVPHLQAATIKVADRSHASTRHLPMRWIRTDEWYDYRANPRGDVHVLATLDERTYRSTVPPAPPGSGGQMGPDHPIAWCHRYEGGRSWYTGGGHTEGSYGEPAFQRHLLGGIRWAAGIVKGGCRATIDSSYQKVTLNDHPGEPMSLAVLPDGRVLHNTRQGEVRMHDPRTGLNTVAARLDVYEHDEEGLQSVAIDPDFRRNRWVYLYYSPPGGTPVDDPATPNVNEGDAPVEGTEDDWRRFRGAMRLSRFKLRGAGLDLDSEQKIIDVPVDRGLCCHVGGQIDFDARGNLYLSTGDDTFPFLSDGYSPLDERLDHNPALDSQRSSANTNDLRGKLLRIRPKSRGGYAVPAGNLFPKGRSRTRPEIFAMGLRNPFRFTVDRRTGRIFLADYSPDATVPRLLRGPAGHGRWMVIRKPGNYGWPYCVTRDAPYFDYDFATGRSAGPFPCRGTLVNDSPRNTGRRLLPPVVQPEVWYPLTKSALFPELGAGFGVGPMAGPAYDYRRVRRSRVRWPRHYDGVPLFYEWTRDYVREFRLERSGTPYSISPVLGSFVFDNPMDMEFGPDGALYVLEYGDGYNRENPEAQLSRIDFVRGGHTPVPKLSARPIDGAAPLNVAFSSEGSTDADDDRLRYRWDFESDGRVDSHAPSPSHTYRSNGVFDATLRVIDPSGRSASTSAQIVVGRIRPTIRFVRPVTGQAFQFGQAVPFEVAVTDPEGPVDCGRVSVIYSLGHNEHAHPQTTAAGCRGVIQTAVDTGHAGATNLRGVFQAEYRSRASDEGPALTAVAEVVLTPAG